MSHPARRGRRAGVIISIQNAITMHEAADSVITADGAIW